MIQMSGHEYFKIGRASNVKQRMAHFQLPSKPKLIMSVKVANPAVVELILHREFEDKRLYGEWFNLDPNDLSEIKAKLASHESSSFPVLRG